MNQIRKKESEYETSQLKMSDTYINEISANTKFQSKMTAWKAHEKPVPKKNKTKDCSLK